MRTQEEITQEISRLEAIKPKVPPRSLFGDDNHEAIDTQIYVLKERAHENTIYEKYSDDEQDYIRGAAMQVCDWLFNGAEDVPSDDWKELVS